ncbi:MAG: glutaminase A [Salana multivorans]|uniref:glutaminase A n=1 Tax=Salana multivorans TaxID=120377 RepID=UPI0009699D3A|nr:glutaminase A [Salana multivorans]MBN8883824.1 glutaminase A [Salana multivorans]OJX97282.1 MAG: glutaminase [Micrococcales bacterium 73-15]
MFDEDVLSIAQLASTGALPPGRTVDELVRLAHERYAGVDDGAVADYIPVLAEADPRRFGLAVVGVDGERHEAGDTDVAFSIQSISKAFVLALVCEELGHRAVRERVGVNNTGLPFNSVIALELNAGSPSNPMVNAGAIATTALLPAASAEERWERVRDGLSRFAGRDLELDETVYVSEAETNQRNRAIAKLLQSYDRLDVDPLETVDVYTRQCALAVTAHDLAVMGATLADGGTNPVTGEQVVSAEVCRDTLAVLASCGLYERSGDWLFEIGLPAKSGVSGGIVAVAPGKGALGAYSPRLDAAGNSVRGQRACAYLSRALGLNLFASSRWSASEQETPHV